jgi:hypothetical protein
LIFLAVVVGLVILATSLVGLRAILAVINPPRLNDLPISVANLLRQLTSPINVLRKTLGDGPLAMRIQLDTLDKERVRFEMTRSTTSSVFVPSERGVRLDTSESRGFEARSFQDIQIDPVEMIQPLDLQYSTRPDGRGRARSAQFSPLRRDTSESSVEDGQPPFDGRFQPRSRDEDEISFDDGTVFEPIDVMSEEEGRVFIGYQQRQLARENQLANPDSRPP